MKRPCPRTLDKPIHLFGLEPEDVSVIILCVGCGCLMIGPFWPGIMGVMAWCVMLVFKKDKPQGYLIHWLYIQGMCFPGLIFPIKRIKQYAIR